MEQFEKQNPKEYLVKLRLERQECMMFVIEQLDPALKGFDGTEKEVRVKFEYLVKKYNELADKQKKHYVEGELIDE